MAKHILFLDDSDERHAVMEKSFPDEVYPAATLAQFADALERCGKIDEVWLDHDLGAHDGGVSETCFSGFAAALLLTALPRHRREDIRRVRIHSWNPTGARRMMDVLEAHNFPVIYNPFSHSSDGEADNLERAYRRDEFDHLYHTKKACRDPG